MNCSRCHASNRDGLRFCESCGAPLADRCPQCAAPIVGDARFCGVCGASFAPAGPERFESPAAYTPAYLADRILNSRSAMEGERKQVTVLFCDFTDSTALAERIGPEAMHRLLDEFFELALGEVHRYEGTINQFLGDGFMALFGAPLAREDHARRGVLAALGLRSVLRERALGAPHRRLDLDVRMGINTGLVVVGKIGHNLRMDYTAVGDTTHVAHRLEQMAEPGTILITGATHRLVRGYVRVEDLGAQALKGKAEPVPVYRVLGPGARRSRLEGPDRAHKLTRFVGRERELDTLQGLLARVEAGEGQVVTIVGESGVGKSRLFHEFRQRQRGRSVTFLEGRCLSYGRRIPYLPVLDILRQGCGIAETDSPEAIGQKVDWALGDIGVDAADAAPYLLHLLGVTNGTEALAALSPQAIKSRTADVLRRLVLKESRRQPLVILVEDVHWVDRTSEEYATTLIDALVDAPLLMVLTHRPGYDPGWLKKPYVTRLALSQLSDGESLAVLQAIVEPGGVHESVTRSILAKAEGNPLFLEELSRAAFERDGLGTDDALPATIHDLLSARIDSLSQPARRVVQAAAVLGREVSHRLLEAVADQPESLAETVRELTRREMLYEHPRVADRVYVFRHALVQEVAYSTLLEQRRAALHGRAARALETLYDRRTDEVVELLAHHFGRSGDAEKAVDYAILAGEKAQRRWANAEGLAHFGAALSRLDALPESAANSLRRIDAVLRQGEVRFAVGQHVEQRTLLEQIGPLVERAADPPRRAAWHYWTGFLHTLTGGRPELVIDHCERAVAIAESGGLIELGAFAESCLAQVYVFAGELRLAVETGERALRTFETLGNRWWAGRTLSHLAAAANALGQWDRAFGYCHRALGHGLAVDDLRLKVSALLRLGLTHIQKGEVAEGLQRCEEAQALAPTPYDAAALRGIRAYGLAMVGRVAEAIAELTEVLDWYARSNLHFTRYQFMLLLGEAHLRGGALESARKAAEEVLVASAEMGYRHLEAIARRLLAESLLALDPPAAERHLRDAVEAFRRSGARSHLARSLIAQAALCHRRGEEARAIAALEEGVTIFREIGTLDHSARVRDALAMLDAGSAAAGHAYHH
ncbi:MAG TPA: AAA family ATPase [Methylomirabilota bacterium]|nr:AAA family ATPase [Methylomirabilota bacterium]